MALAFYDAPGTQMGIIGVVGDVGKTTVSWLVRGILEELEEPTGEAQWSAGGGAATRAPAACSVRALCCCSDGVASQIAGKLVMPNAAVRSRCCIIWQCHHGMCSFAASKRVRQARW